MKRKNIKIAKRIVELEEKMRLDKNDKFASSEIQNIVHSLSLEDMLEIDEYIITNKLIK